MGQEAAVTDFQQRLSAIEPALRLVPLRILRRVLGREHRQPLHSVPTPRLLNYLIDRHALLRHATPAELGCAADKLPDQVLLVVQHQDLHLEPDDPGSHWRYYWRQLFCGRLRRTLVERIRQGAITPNAAELFRQRIGLAAWAELETVLRDSAKLLPPVDDLGILSAFSLQLGLFRMFDPQQISAWFPGLPETGQADPSDLLGLDFQEIYGATRPPELSDQEPPIPSDDPDSGGYRGDRAFTVRQRMEIWIRSRRMRERGNRIGAAISAMQIASAEGGAALQTARSAALEDVEWLSQQLVEVVDEGPTAQSWQRALEPLLEGCVGRMRPEARLLYDLQRACLDFAETEVRVDVVEWVLTFGRRPIRRTLPFHRELRASRHLGQALKKLPRTRLDAEPHERLRCCLEQAVRLAEARLRQVVEPELDAAFSSVGLKPQSVAERVALKKLCTELCDLVVARGFVTMGRLRDAISRNRLKLPNLSGVGEFLRGDQLLRLDRELAVRLDGIYRRGEVYLRWLQRFSALFFGTRPGRFMTRFLILPVGGAVVLLEFAQYLINLFGARAIGRKVVLLNSWSLSGLTLLLLLLIYHRGAREIALSTVRGLGRAIRWLFVGLPMRLLETPAMRWLLTDPTVRKFWRYLLGPLVFALPSLVAIWWYVRDPGLRWSTSPALVLLLSLFLNSRWGATAVEWSLDQLIRSWRRLRYRILPGLIRWVLMVFERAVLSLERLMYHVDIWLRFRQRDRPIMLPVKAGLGMFWFFVTYLFRLYINLLIEPQVNPIKHFPVVTVSHKMILPFTFTLTALLRKPLSPLGPFLSQTIAATTILLLPGVFGFLVWEFKENWRLYDQNRPPELKPVLIGHHGETMVRLLRPGFHSGTVPKQFARLRRSARQGVDPRSRKARLALEQVAHAVEQFLQRELTTLLNESPVWRVEAPSVADVRLSTNTIRISLTAPRLDPAPTELNFSDLQGKLQASLSVGGWVERLDPAHRLLWDSALAGVHSFSGVNGVEPQLWSDWSKRWQPTDDEAAEDPR